MHSYKKKNEGEKMPIDWDEIEERVTRTGRFPPFLRIEGRKGEMTVYITAPIREIDSKYQNKINLGVTTISEDLKEIWTWNMPTSLIKALLSELKDIDQRLSVYKITFAWVGEGRKRRYELLEKELVEKKTIVKKITELLQQYEGLTELLKEKVEEKKDEIKDVVEKIASILEFTKKIPLSQETLNKLGVSRDFIIELGDRGLLKLDKRKEHIVGVELNE